MALNAPIINIPTTEPIISTNMSHMTIGGTADAGVDSIVVNFNGTTGYATVTSVTGGVVSWTFDHQVNSGIDELTLGQNNFVVVAVSGNAQSPPDTFIVIYDPNLESDYLTLLPTGFQLRQQKESVKLIVPQFYLTETDLENMDDEEEQEMLEKFSNFLGYNFYVAEEPGGGVDGFVLLNNAPIIVPDPLEVRQSIVSSQSVTVVGRPTDTVTDNTTIIDINKNISNARTTVVSETYLNISYYSYVHNRITNAIGTKPITEKNHYVITSVFFDPSTKTVVESLYSEELSGKPFVIDTQLKDLPQRTEADFRVAIFDQTLQSNDEIDLKPGTVLRDTVINTEATLLSRNYSILKFLSASQSFATLLSFDDPDGLGFSAPVITTPDKNNLRIALLISEENAQVVQDLIDTAFDKLASNVNTPRLAASYSVGQITIYTTRAPDRDAVVLAGAVCETLADNVAKTASVRFVVLAGFTLRVSELPQYFNQITKRYEFKLNVRAEFTGSVGNVDAGKIITVVSGFDPIFGVINEDATQFGRDRESNSDLADRAILAFLSVDSGTKSGYYSTAIKNIGVERVIVVDANHPLMQRDFDELRGIHVYGKVDIYTKGIQNKIVTETFGFSYKKVKNETFTIQSVLFLEFRATNTDIDETKPIFRVDSVENVTQNKLYNLTNMVITNDGNVIDLDETLPGNTVNPGDIIRVTYAYRASDDIRLATQPVESIESVRGSKSGTFDVSNYKLVRKDDPLLLGRSTDANDSIRFIYSDGIPTGELEVISNEPVVLTGTDAQTLQNVDVDLDTLVVKDITETITYIENVDYSITPGDLRRPPKIVRIRSEDGGSISTGATVLASYTCGEIITVSYNVNDLLSKVKESVDEMRHLCADVVEKSAQLTNIVINMNIILKRGADSTVVDRNVRNNIRTFLKQKKLGISVYESHIIALAEIVDGVSHVDVPISRLHKKDGSQIIREPVPDPDFTLYHAGPVNSYISGKSLDSRTVDTGGYDTEFRQIFQNDYKLEMVNTDTEVEMQAGRGYIRGDGKIIVSLLNNPNLTSDNPDSYNWTVTYTAYNEGDSAGGGSVTKDILLTDIEYADVAAGDLQITYTYIDGSGVTVTTTGT